MPRSEYSRKHQLTQMSEKSYQDGSMRDDQSDYARSTSIPTYNQTNLFDNIHVGAYNGNTRQTIGTKPKSYLKDAAVSIDRKSASIYSSSSVMRTSNPYLMPKRKPNQ